MRGFTIAVAVLLLAPAVARAEPGRLDLLSCVQGTIDRGCASTVAELQSDIGDVAAAPDGRDVYVTTRSGTVTHFRVTPDGLQRVGCIEDPGAADDCPVTADGLAGPLSLEVAPDGQDVLVAGQDDDALVRLRRAADGTLSDGGCVEDAPLDRGCDAATEGLNNVVAVAVSPDGRSVYTAAPTDSAVLHLARASDGQLAAQACVEDQPVDQGCSSTTTSLAGVGDLVVAADGGRVFAVAESDGMLTTFVRAANGSLGTPACVEALPDDGLCPVAAAGLTSVTNLALHPDGRTLYTSSGIDRAVVAWEIDDEHPAVLACVGDTPGCRAHGELQAAREIAVAPDGRTLYVQVNAGITALELDAAGAPGRTWCLEDTGSTVRGCARSVGTLGIFVNSYYNGLAMAPDGSRLYASATLDGVLTVLRRDRDPVCAATGAATTPGTAVEVAPRCTDPDGDPITFEVVDAPRSGALAGLRYAPAAGFAGVDRFTYRARTANAVSAPAEALVAVAAPPGSGPAGPAGPAGTVADRVRLLALLVEDRLAARRGRSVAVRVVATAPGAVLLELRRAGRRVAVARGRVGATGRATVRLAVPRSARRARHELRLVVTGPGDQVARDTGRLTVR
jgi:DNA-binding beta-propeller fold protein YncE